MTMNVVDVDMTLEQATNTINSLIQQGNTGTHQIGVLYNHIVDKRLAIVAGYKDARTYFSQHVKALSQNTLSVYGRVAKAFPESICTQHGPYKLRSLLVYVEAAGLGVPADPVGFPVDVVGEDGKVVPKPFEACSVDEIDRATRAKKTPPRERVPVMDQARLLFLLDSLGRNFPGSSPVRMTSRSEEGKTLISLQDVPMEQLGNLMQALQEGMAAKPTAAVK